MSTTILIPNGPTTNYRLYSDFGDFVIDGNYQLLNLIGSQIMGGRIYAAKGASANNVLLSGVEAEQGINLSQMRILRENDHSERPGLVASGLSASYISMGCVEDIVDLSWSKIGNVLFGEDRIHYLNLYGGSFGTIDFGNAEKRFDAIDLRSTTIDEVRGIVPMGAGHLLTDQYTRIPKDLCESLRKYSIHQESY